MFAVIRLAAAGDAPEVQAIYAPYCLHTPVSFEEEAPGVEEMGRRIVKALARLPWLVAEEGGRVLGYVYASPHRERAAYRWSVEVTAYAAAGQRRRGVGRALYTSLLALLRLQGYVSAYAGIALPNPASVGLHEAVGFRPVGVYRAVGFKCGAWHDVGWWQRPLCEPPPGPAEPADLPQAQRLPGWADALAAGLPLLRPGPA